MDKLTQEGQINLAMTILYLIVMFAVILIGIFIVTDGFVKTMVITFGIMLPCMAIFGTWTDNFGKWYLQTKQDFKKMYYVK
jgi:uncharacterized protein (UPF0333 family)